MSIGTGNLTLPLAELGVKLYGSDLSDAMLQKCEEKAKDKRVMVHTRQSDFRELAKHFAGERFEEHYYPVRRSLLLDKLQSLEYQQLQVMCHPACFENQDLDKVEWYCVIAGKP